MRYIAKLTILLQENLIIKCILFQGYFDKAHRQMFT